VLGNVAQGPQATRGAVHQAQLEAELFGDLQGLVGLVGQLPEGALADWQGQTLTRVAVGSGGLRAELLGEAFAWRAEAIGPAAQGVLLDLAEVMVGAEPLED